MSIILYFMFSLCDKSSYNKYIDEKRGKEDGFFFFLKVDSPFS